MSTSSLGADEPGAGKATESSGPPIDSPERLAAINRYEILDAPTDGAFDRVARMTATIFETPIATVSIVDADRVWFAAALGLDGVRQIGVEPGLCASVVLKAGPYIVFNADLDPRTLEHPLVRGALGLRFYAAAPIVSHDGHKLGTVTAIDRTPRAPGSVTETQTGLLTELAGSVADLLEVKLSTMNALRAERLLRIDDADRAEVARELAQRINDALYTQSAPNRPDTCQLGGTAGCQRVAELKIADAWGDSAWGCQLHAEEALVNVPSVFRAMESADSLAAYMNRSPAAEVNGGSATS